MSEIQELIKNFPADFERISAVKGNDKILIYDSSTGTVCFATPSQINSMFDTLVADIETAVEAAAAAIEAKGDAEAALSTMRSEIAAAVQQAVATATATATSAANTATTKAADAAGSASSAASALQQARDARDAAQGYAEDADDSYNATLGALAGVLSMIRALGEVVDNGGHHKAISYDAEEGFKVCGKRVVILGHGVPSADTIPETFGIPAFEGQLYINKDAESAGLYYAKGTSAVADWKNANS